MYSEDDLLPLSGLQHLHFCPRQCALIHVEQTWVENRYTAEGRVMHEQVDSAGHERRGDVRRTQALLIRSLRLGLSGKADVVEFCREEDGAWRPFPVEHKRGRPKPDNCDRVQLCAQAMCLEEMLGTDVPEGALFYGKQRRREPVAFDEALRTETESLAVRLHELVGEARTPVVPYSAKCDRCSLLEICRPKAVGVMDARRYVRSMIKED